MVEASLWVFGTASRLPIRVEFADLRDNSLPGETRIGLWMIRKWRVDRVPIRRPGCNAQRIPFDRSGATAWPSSSLQYLV
jgi:hypothetical protein